MKQEIREATIERSFVRQVEAKKAIAMKLVSPGRRGVPDRQVLTDGGRMCFVELKAPGKKPTPLQEKWHKDLRALGFLVFVIDSYESIETFMQTFFGEDD